MVNEQNVIISCIFKNPVAPPIACLEDNKTTTPSGLFMHQTIILFLLPIGGKLDPKEFPILPGSPQPTQESVSSGRWGANKTNGTNPISNSRIIVFMLGGMCYSECRVGYEITKEKNNKWEVILGSSQILTPVDFLDEVKKLSEPLAEEPYVIGESKF